MAYINFPQGKKTLPRLIVNTVTRNNSVPLINPVYTNTSVVLVAITKTSFTKALWLLVD